MALADKFGYSKDFPVPQFLFPDKFKFSRSKFKPFMLPAFIIGKNKILK